MKLHNKSDKTARRIQILLFHSSVSSNGSFQFDLKLLLIFSPTLWTIYLQDAYSIILGVVKFSQIL